jgi:outer membrane protein assembly factor BamB
MASALMLSVSATGWAGDAPLGHKDFVPTPERPVGWRGDGTGCFPGATPPIEWSETKNIIWKTPMPSWTNASPVPMGDPAGEGAGRAFTCAEKTTLICCDAASGKTLWSQNHDDLGLKVEIRTDIRHSTPTPICDGKRVYARFANGVNVAYDLDGNRQWLTVRGDNKPNAGIMDASPALFGNRLIICVGRELLGLDTASGREVWKYNTGNGDPNSHSPVIGRLGDAAFVIPAFGRGLNTNGEPSTPDLGINACNTSPMFFDGVVYCIGEKRGGKGWNAATRLAASGAEFTCQQLWKNRLGAAMGRNSGFADGPLGAKEQERFFASPVLYEGLLVTQNQRGELYALNPATGEVVKKFNLALPQKRPPQGNWAYFSPAVAGGYLFIAKEGGPVVVFQGKELKEVARNYLDTSGTGGGQMNGSTMAFHGDRAFLRTIKALYCIGIPNAAFAPAVGTK